jgi:hypothetical protein
MKLPSRRSLASIPVLSAAALGLFAGCQPTVPTTPPPSTVVIAQFDPTKSQLPLPNDLLLAQPVASLGLAPAEGELIGRFQQQGGFPNDQEVPITVTFTTLSTDPSAPATAPALDLSSFTPQTFFVTVVTGAQSGLAPVAALTAADYVVSGSVGTLTIHSQGHLPWAPGEYAVFIRGGASGVKTKGGAPVYPSQVFYLIAQGLDLTAPQNIGLLAAQAGSVAAALPQAQQLNGVIKLFNDSGAFAACDAVFPHQELAVASTFRIAPLATQVQLDPGRGLVPLPIDLLRIPGPTGKLTPLAACTFASGTLAADGGCSSAAAAGFAALDGFSTTGAILAPTSDLIRASTVTPTTVQLYDLTDPAHPALVPAASYLDEPCEFTSTCDPAAQAVALSPVVALQPAGATSGDASSVFRTRPLKDATDYAVVISDGVLDKAGHPLHAGTVASILTFANPLVDAKGKSQLQGVDDLTAGALEVMRGQLKPVLAAAGQAGIGAGHVAMAYTFRTQTILSTAVQLAALPYAAAPASFVPGSLAVLTPAQAFTKYGLPAAVPSSNIGQVLEAKLVTLNLLDPLTGAFKSDPTQAQAEVINALISVPVTPARTSQGLTPLVIFRHGLGGGRADMLALADAFAQRGVILAAIDAAKHGDRAFCTKGVSTVSAGGVQIPVCADGAACQSPLPAGAQGDLAPPGTCAAGFFYAPVSGACNVPASCPGYDHTKGGIPVVSANYLVSANFFRTRDTMRQDLIDQSQLIHVLAPRPPTPLGPLGNPVFDALLLQGIVIDPQRVGYIGQSLGSIQGVPDVAANPRITSAVFNVGGGTTVDIFTNSPAFVSTTDQLLAGLGVVPGTAGYLQFLVIAKMVLDPADPVNFAGHLKANTLPNLLGTPSGAPQAPKQVLAQASLCDQVVPNPFNYILDSNLGTGPLPGATGFGGPGSFQVFLKGTGPADAAALSQSCSAVTANWVTHGALLDFADPLMTSKIQADAAQFLVDGLPPTSLVILP